MNHKIAASAPLYFNNSSVIQTKSQTRYPDLIFKRHEEEILGEKSLWRAVITQALMDAGSNSSKRESKYDRAKAISWLSGKSKDFLTVCALADLEPDYVLEKSREALKRGCSWRNQIKENADKKIKNGDNILNLQNYLNAQNQ